jgi:hypothetical protein
MKIFNGLAILAAIFLVYLGFKGIKFNLEPNLNKFNIESINRLAKVSDDADNDGLKDTEESYWNTDPNNPDSDGDGYLDGEEVVTGHNPLIPSPEDKIDYGLNLTERLSEVTLSGLIEGSLKPSNSSFNDSVNLVIDDLLNQSELKLPKRLYQFNVVENSPENIKEYIEKIMPLIISYIKEEGERIKYLLLVTDNLNLFGSGNLENENKIKLINFLNSELPKLENLFDTLIKSKVPKYIEPNHKQITNLIGNSINNYILLKNLDKDPVQALISIGYIFNIFLTDMPDVIVQYSQATPQQNNNH